MVEAEDIAHVRAPGRPAEVMVGGVRVSCMSRQNLLDRMVADSLAARKSAGRPTLVFDANGHALSLAACSPDYRWDLDAADIVHADGQPIVIASRLLTDHPVPERSATTDMFTDAAAVAARTGLSFFLLGGTETVNKRCAELIEDRYAGLHVVGRRNGYFDQADEEAICAEINASGADVVWVGLGKPKEQAFCVRNRDRIGAGWLITCGGCFNYVTGDYGRAPMWMQRAGLEWLYRMAMDPERFLIRYLTTNPHALLLILTRTRRRPIGLPER